MDKRLPGLRRLRANLPEHRLVVKYHREALLQRYGVDLPLKGQGLKYPRREPVRPIGQIIRQRQYIAAAHIGLQIPRLPGEKQIGHLSPCGVDREHPLIVVHIQHLQLHGDPIGIATVEFLHSLLQEILHRAQGQEAQHLGRFLRHHLLPLSAPGGKEQEKGKQHCRDMYPLFHGQGAS